MGRPLWVVEFFKKTYRRKDIVFKMTGWPIIGKILKKMVFEDDNLICLPKDNVIEINKSVETGETIVPSKIVEHFIEKSNYRWIMNFCICRESNNCKNYPHEYGCLFLGEAVKGINPKLGRMVSKEEALEYVKKCREAGLIHQIGQNKLDTIWLGIGPGDKLFTICNCCECCCLAGGIQYVPPQIAKQIYHKMPGVEVKVTERCVGCGTCEKVCFLNAIQIMNKKAYINQDLCRGCGRCVEKCPKNAIELTFNDAKCLEKSIKHLSYISV